jgi:two-component system cell cycle sensor histidine kinase/response regulator CckA
MPGHACSCSPKEILYIDDDPAFGYLAKYMLERIGHKVTVFAKGQEALDALSSQPGQWDLVITDFRMPGLSGIEVARAVRDRHPGLPYAVISSYTGGEAVGAAVGAGLGAVLPKPTTLGEFEALVEEVTAPAVHQA